AWAHFYCACWIYGRCAFPDATGDQMSRQSFGIQQIQPSLADSEAFPKGGGSAKSFKFAA
ncbi:MAG TPA: hypothetical protein VGR97_02570, partial [Candidatus Acidoferrales bacterium]|nr:hypothetical protein [Candidatus Acidoferrales bacterium]